MPATSTNSPRSRPAARESEPADSAVAEFEALYRANVAAVTAYFARRSADPQTVADLTADTFVQAITSFATFDPRTGGSVGAGGIITGPVPRRVSLPSAPQR